MTTSSATSASAVELATKDLSLSEIRLAAAGLIAKHQGYLRLIFFNFPTKIRSALYDEEVGWRAILLEHLSGNPKIEAWTACQALFRLALIHGIPQHKTICGTKSHEGNLLVCEGEGNCSAQSNGETLIQKHSLSDDEAKVLFDLLQIKISFILTLHSEDYTPVNITELLQRT